MRWSTIKLGREEHGFICGATGTGKSVLARFLLEDERKAYSVTYDPKHSRTIGQWSRHTFIYSWDDLIGSDARRIVYRPTLEEAEDAAAQKEFFKWIYTQQHVRLYVDECSALLGDSNPNFYLKGCLTRGRELGISVLCATQRPVSIPLITMSEATRLYVFRLNLEEDRKRVAKITGISDDEQLGLRQYEFFYFDVIRGRIETKLKLDLSSLYQQGVMK